MTAPRDLQTNPLINPPELRHGAPPLDIVREDHFLPAIEYGIAAHQAEIDAIKNNPEPPTFGNTIVALQFAGADLERAASVFNVFSNTKSNVRIQEIDTIIREKMAEHDNNIGLDESLFARIKSVYDSPESEYLGEQEKRVLEKTYNGYVRSGALLLPEQKQRLREIDSQLATLTVRFENNVVESRNAYKLVTDLSALDGVPEDIVEAARKQAEQEGLAGKAVLRLNSSTPRVIEYSADRNLRETLVTAQRNVACAEPHDNRPIILEIVKLRHELAQLFGYDTYSAFVLANRMAKTPETVQAFLEKNLKTYKAAADEHIDKLKTFARERDGIEDLRSWDTAYYNRLLTEQTYQLNMKDFRPYFSLDNVLRGFHSHLEKAFGIELREQPYPVHKPEVRVYEAFNKASGAFVGLFYTNYAEDNDPATSKRGGAWMSGFRDRSVRNGQVTAPIITNDCNYKRQTEDGAPTLLDINDDITVRHEGGHGMHGLLTTSKYPSLSGTRVKRDWVEVPSQLQENWATQKDVLRTYAIHDGKPLPDEMVDKLIALQNFGAGMQGLRQTWFGLVDMLWHNTDPAAITSVEDVERQVSAIASTVPGPDSGAVSTSFTHIFSGGYSSGYYSYKWAEVLEADIFSLFEKNGLYHQPTLDAVRKHIYESGDMRDPDVLFRDLMGRDPDPSALFRREGLLPKTPPRVEPVLTARVPNP